MATGEPLRHRQLHAIERPLSSRTPVAFFANVGEGSAFGDRRASPAPSTSRNIAPLSSRTRSRSLRTSVRDLLLATGEGSGARNRRLHCCRRPQNFRDQDSAQDQRRSQQSPRAQPFVKENERREAGEYRLQRKNDGRVICAGVLLRPDLHGKGQGRGENSRDDDGRDESQGSKEREAARSPSQPKPAGTKL